MRFRIHFNLADGSEDSIVLSADSLKDIRRMAVDEMHHRGVNNIDDAWSEELLG